jgi:hypothetical protein
VLPAELALDATELWVLVCVLLLTEVCVLLLTDVCVLLLTEVWDEV